MRKLHLLAGSSFLIVIVLAGFDILHRKERYNPHYSIDFHNFFCRFLDVSPTIDCQYVLSLARIGKKSLSVFKFNLKYLY